MQLGCTAGCGGSIRLRGQHVPDSVRKGTRQAETGALNHGRVCGIVSPPGTVRLSCYQTGQ